MRLIAVLVLFLVAPAFADDSVIRLQEGTQKALKIEGVTRIAIGDPSIVDVEPHGKQELLIRGVSEGKTTLLLWKADQTRISFLLHVTPGGRGEKPTSTVAPPPETPPNETLSVVRGETRTLSMPGIERLAVGDPSVADLSVEGKSEVKITGRSAGETTVIIWRDGRRRYAIRVKVSP